MKVLHINCNYIGTTLHQLMIEELDKREIENQIFVPTYDKGLSVIEPRANVTVSQCFSKNDRLIFGYKQSKIIRAIEENYDVGAFDLIHGYTLFTDGNAAMRLSEKYGVPYVVAVRNTDVNAFFRRRRLLRKKGIDILLSSERSFFLSPSYEKKVLEQYVPDEYREEIRGKGEIVPNGIDDFWLRNVYRERNYEEIGERLKDKRLRLIFAGGIDKNKNIVSTCKAVDLLRKEGWTVELTVVGKIRDEREYERIKDYVRYIPRQPKEKLMDLYRSADIFAMPSIFESFGLVYAEAMSQGLPVLYSKGQGFDEQFSEGEVGFHVSGTDGEDIADKIKSAVRDYESISRRATERVHRFSWERICGEYYRIYQEIAGRK